MIQKALEYILKIQNPEQMDINGRTYASKHLVPVEPPEPSPIKVTTLSGVVSYLKSGIDGLNVAELIGHVVSPTRVEIFPAFEPMFCTRPKYITAKPILPELFFDEYMNTDRFNIFMQSAFVNDNETDKANILAIIGNIREEAVKETADDGITQAVTVRQGIARVAERTVPNPVTLRPYRTFVEVEQPASEFIFRMESGPKCKLIEADGGAWRNEAMANIAAYLSTELPELKVIS